MPSAGSGAEPPTVDRQLLGVDTPICVPCAWRLRFSRPHYAFRNLVIPLNAARMVKCGGSGSSGQAVNSTTQGSFLGYRGAGTDVTETGNSASVRSMKIAARPRPSAGSPAASRTRSNNLLQPIIIYATFGSGDDAATRARTQKRYFNRIVRAAEAATLIVRNVLSFARQRPPHRDDGVAGRGRCVRPSISLGDALPNRGSRASSAADRRRSASSKSIAAV